jgi:uncharacterized protein YcfJ
MLVTYLLPNKFTKKVYRGITVNKSMIVGTVLGAVGVTAAGTMASLTLMEDKPKFAEVLNVRPITKTVETPRQQCRDVVITHRKPVKDKHQLTGTIAGAIVGGILGKQVGGGNGKKLATAVGAAAGGFAGNKVQKDIQAKDTYTSTEQRCETVVDTREDVVGYTVKYQLDGVTDTIRMDHKPEKQIPVVEGKLVLTKAENTQTVQ